MRSVHCSERALKCRCAEAAIAPGLGRPERGAERCAGSNTKVHILARKCTKMHHHCFYILLEFHDKSAFVSRKRENVKIAFVCIQAGLRSVLYVLFLQQLLVFLSLFLARFSGREAARNSGGAGHARDPIIKFIGCVHHTF